MLQPDYSTTSVDYKNYDPPRDLSCLLPEATVEHVFLNKLTTYKQLKELSSQQYDCFVNLCEGYLHWEIPSIDVIYSMELLDLPFTGPTTQLYDPSKEIMKYVAYTESVATPAYAIVCKGDDILKSTSHLTFPLFVKPAHAGDSLGIDEHSLVENEQELLQKAGQLTEQYNEVMIEEYIDGREFTVLVMANSTSSKTSTAFTPLEYVFPEDRKFKTYAMKTSELHAECNVLCKDKVLSEYLKSASQKIFKGFDGVGYARLDFRVDKHGRIFFLEINFTCSVFYTGGYEGSADYILSNDGVGQAAFLRHIISEGIARHRRKRKKYLMRGNSIAGFGIYAIKPIAKGEVIFCGEENEHRMVTKRFVEQHWTEEEKKNFRHYAVPVSDEVYVIWNKNPSSWAPQNHSCSPNTAYDGLNVIALRDIAKDEELTLDYANILDETAEAFTCNCGAFNCRSIVSGIKNNSFTQREKEARGRS